MWDLWKYDQDEYDRDGYEDLPGPGTDTFQGDLCPDYRSELDNCMECERDSYCMNCRTCLEGCYN